MKRTDLMALLGLEIPIIQAPMAGGSDSPELAAAVSEAGGLGSIGATYLTPEAFKAAAEAIRGRTNRAFCVNLFAPQPVPERPDDFTAAVSVVSRHSAAVGGPPADLPKTMTDPFERNFPTALESGAKVLSFIMGTLPDDAVRAAKARGMILFGTATTAAEAKAVERNGGDAVIAQGGEAGGHQGIFDGTVQPAGIGTVALVPQIVDAVSIPVIAAGGIMDGRGIAAALALGAQAVQMGTAFLTSDEAGAPECHRAAIMAANAEDTRLTRAFSGRVARGIKNPFMEAIEPGGDAKDVLPFPWQNALTRPMRTAGTQAGDGSVLSLWAGQGVGLSRRRPAAELMATLAAETEAAIKRLRG
ncbi:MAG: nitronate monooxygenase [Rhodospirillaceae bacterium]